VIALIKFIILARLLLIFTVIPHIGLRPLKWARRAVTGPGRTGKTRKKYW